MPSISNRVFAPPCAACLLVCHIVLELTRYYVTFEVTDCPRSVAAWAETIDEGCTGDTVEQTAYWKIYTSDRPSSRECLAFQYDSTE